jgi:hypothetical protein
LLSPSHLPTAPSCFFLLYTHSPIFVHYPSFFPLFFLLPSTIYTFLLSGPPYNFFLLFPSLYFSFFFLSCSSLILLLFTLPITLLYSYWTLKQISVLLMQHK